MSQRVPVRVLVTTLSLAVACLAAGPETRVAAESQPEAAAQAGSIRVLGTVTARLSGTDRTWHVVAGPSKGHAYSSAVWLDTSSGRRTLAIGGFDTPAPPLDSFEWGENGMPTSYGRYPGSTILINLTVGQAPAPFTLSYPSEVTPAVMYTTRATRNPLPYTFGISKGLVNVTSVSIDGGLASAAGTFTGSLKIMIGEGTLEVTDGTFTVAGVPNAATLR